MADILISKFTTQIPRVGATPATPGFAESEGQDPVAPSGTPQVYTPVTIGSPANGLSISGTQVLTIGLASTSTTGALSSTDWNTFNGKLNLTSPITGYTVGANTAIADTDTILQAFGKVQGQINARISGTIASGQVAFGTGVNTVGGDSGLTWDNATKVLTAIGQQIFQGSTASDTAPLGTELATTGSGTNWTGSSFATGYTHTIGSTQPLTTSTPALNATYYQIAYTITGRTTGSITINFGGTSTAGITATGAVGPLSTSTANLEIVPTTDFNGTIVLSVRSIGTSSATTTIRDSGGTARLEIRAASATDNTLVGLFTGRRITTGTQNTFFGVNAGSNTTTGSHNIFFGVQSGILNTTGTFNAYFGSSAGSNGTSASNNIAIGGSALFFNTTGSNNIAFGGNAGGRISDGVTANTVTSNSIFIGQNTRANANNETNQIVIGHTAIGGGSNTTTIGNSSTVSTRLPAGSLWVNTTSGTNTLDVNGTARIRTISNLGSAATSVLVPSATGVVSLRTLAELASDMGNAWTSVGTGNIFRNSRISVGHTADPTESIDLGASGWIRTGQGASNAGGVILPFTSANANSRSWTFRNDAGGFGEIGLTVSATQAGDPKTGNLIFRLTNIGNVGINGAPDAFSNYRYFSLYGASTTLGGVFIAKTSNSSHTFQLRVDSTANHLQALNNPMIFYCGTGGAERMRITNNGNLLINTTTDLGYKLYNVGTTGLDGNITLIDTTGTNIVFGTTTGSQIGTATNQRLAFYGSTPIVKPSGDILTALSNLGLITSPTITQVDQFAVKTTASADQTLPSGVLTILDYDTTLTNNSTATYTVGTTGRITINTTGIYTITAGVVIEADAVTALESAFLGIFRNGDLVAISSINTTIAAGAQSGLSTSTILSLTATDIIDCRALVNSVGGVANGLARRLGTLLGANATQVNSLSITKNSM